MRQQTTCGLSLLEVLISVTLIMMVGVATLKVVANSRVLRTHAVDRSELALIASNTLNRQFAEVSRQYPLEEFSNRTLRTDLDIPTTETVTLAPYGENLSLLSVTVERENPRATHKFTLERIIGGNND